ncbi:unnamed protein product [Auanema sp. JU1783]|nr:unnamed protein product [Auanema sp. JU1783]
MAKSTVSPAVRERDREKNFVDEKKYFLLALQAVCSIQWNNLTTIFWIVFFSSNAGSVLLILLHLPIRLIPYSLVDTTSNFVFSCAVASLLSSISIVLLRKKIIQQLLIDPYDLGISQKFWRKVFFNSMPCCSLCLALYTTVIKIVLSPERNVVYSIIHSVFLFITTYKLYLNFTFYLVVIYQLTQSTSSLKIKIQLFTGGPLEEISLYQLQRLDRCLVLLEQIQNIFIFLTTITSVYFLTSYFMLNDLDILILTLPYELMTLSLVLSNCHLNNLTFSFKKAAHRLFDLQGVVSNASVLIGYFTFLSRTHLIPYLSWCKVFIISSANISYISIISIFLILRLTNFA